MNTAIRQAMLSAFTILVMLLQAPAHAEVRWSGSSDNSVVHIGSDSYLGVNEKADDVVAIAGSSTSEGEVSDAVVAVMGNVRVTGNVAGDVTAVMGHVYVNSKIGGTVVAVLGDVELGPQAEVSGDVVTVGGRLIRDPAAVIHGETQEVGLPAEVGQLEWLRPWVRHALLYGRPLAIDPSLDWAWALALGFLVLYAFIALLFPEPVRRCVRTLETQPGASLLAAFLSLLLTPLLILLLLVTVIGIAVVPFLLIALFFIGLFGKAVILAALGRRVMGGVESPIAPMTVAVLIGGAIVLALYLVPFVGFLVFNLIAVLGFGVVLYTLMLGNKGRNESGASTAAPSTAGTSTGAPNMATPGLSETQVNAGASNASASSRNASNANTFNAGASAAAQETPTMSDTPGGSAASSQTPPPSQPIPPSTATSLPRASFAIRMAALLIDIVLLAVITNIVFHRTDVFGTFLLPLAIYGAAMWKLRGSTIGGIVCHLQVVRLDGREIDWATAIVRALSCFLSLVAAGLGFFWILFDAERQAWHDKIAGTVVVRAPKGISLV